MSDRIAGSWGTLVYNFTGCLNYDIWFARQLSNRWAGCASSRKPKQPVFPGAASKSFPFIAANGKHINFLRNAQAFDLQVILFRKR